MPFEPLRFVHAADLRLDRPVEAAGPLPDEVRPLVEDATFTAFENVVAACLDNRADFLLLTGDSFIEADRSLRARAALLAGLQRLAEREIRVFVMPGTGDGPAGWRAIADLPDNVTVFDHGGGEPVAVIRDGRVIASVVGITGQTTHQRNPSAQDHETEETPRPPLTIGLQTPSTGEEPPRTGETPRSGPRAPVDYLALGGRSRRQTVRTDTGVIHHPGSVQGLRMDETGVRGCSLVSVGAQGETDCRLVPAAPVRRERLRLDVDGTETLENVASAMQDALDQHDARSSERVWVIHWTIRGEGHLAETLRREETQRELTALCNRMNAAESELFIQHRFAPSAPAERNIPADGLAREYLDGITELEAQWPEALHECISAAGLPDTAWTARLERLAAGTDQTRVLGPARHWSAAWFGPQEDGSS